MENKLLIISHIGDNDGVTPIILANLTFKNFDKKLIEVKEVDETVKENIEKYNRIYILDLNVSDEMAEIINQNEEINTGNEETPNTNSEVISNSQSNQNDTILIEGATNEDKTTANSSIPQTGGISTLVIIGVIAVIGIACYIRYRAIQVK